MKRRGADLTRPHTTISTPPPTIAQSVLAHHPTREIRGKGETRTE
jgi:hypothetical protein